MTVAIEAAEAVVVGNFFHLKKRLSSRKALLVNARGAFYFKLSLEAFMDIKNTIFLRLFGLAKIPMLFACSPEVVKMSAEETVVKIPLNFMTKNHMGAMYFGVLAMGADCAGGLMAMSLIRQSKKKVSLLFKDFKADFLRRAEADVYFTCTEGKKIAAHVKEAIRKKARVNRTLKIVATTPSISGDEPVAKFDLTLSLKGS